ncbi:type II toxin-antitoxin system mRNA interferase toxin, RelE/StbE family [Pseudomonas guariconensis]|uniref:type II toxin-antitoxin system mRNA interferase toxin, RelE/StbE family n=2 Tax=Pseudomonas TaxID=286 RepID=UPI0039782848
MHGWMAYRLEFFSCAMNTVRGRITRLRERLQTPRVQADIPGHYKIKLKAFGHRLVYRVEDERVVVSMGKGERGEVSSFSGERCKPYSGRDRTN